MDLSPSESIDKIQQINPNNTPSESTGTLTVDQLDIELLPVIYDVIRCVEKDQRESQECSQKILELLKRFESARNQIKQLPGINYSKREQLQKLELLKSQLQLKQQLIRKYKKMVLRVFFRYLANNEQLIQKMSESYPMRRAAQQVVAMMYKTKSIVDRRGLTDMTPEKFKEFVRAFNKNLKQEIEDVKEELKRKK